MKKFITIGSCLAYMIGDRYLKIENASFLSSTRHNRIDKIVDTYLEKNQQELPYSYLSGFDFDKDSPFDLVQQIDNQFSDRSLGKTSLNPDTAVGLVDIVEKYHNIDLIIYNSYCDIFFKLLMSKDKSRLSFFFNTRYSSNWEAFFELEQERIAIDRLINYYTKFIEFLRKKNPIAKIIFLNFPFFHHRKKSIVLRIKNLNDSFIRNEFLRNNCYFFPAVNIPSEYIQISDPAHFREYKNRSVYRDYASIIQCITNDCFSHTEWYQIIQKIEDFTWEKLKFMFVTDKEDNMQQSNQEFAMTYFNKGQLLENEGKTEEAIATYKKAIEIEPKNSMEVYKKLDRFLDRPNNRDELLKIYQRAVQHDPDNYWFHKRLGDLLQKQGYLDDAISSYQESIVKNSDFSWSYRKLGEALEKKGNRYLEEAITSYRKAVQLTPKAMGDVKKKADNLSRVLERKEENDFKPSDRNGYWQKRKNDVLYQIVKTLAYGYAPEGVSVLDVGCHTSSFIFELDWFTQRTVADMPSLADYWKKVKGVNFVSGDFLKSQFDTTFDLVLCTQVIEHLQEPKPFIQKLLSVGKTIIVSTTYEVPKGVCKYHIQDPISLETFKSWFDTELTATVIVRQPNNKVWRNIIGVVTKEK